MGTLQVPIYSGIVTSELQRLNDVYRLRREREGARLHHPRRATALHSKGAIAIVQTLFTTGVVPGLADLHLSCAYEGASIP